MIQDILPHRLRNEYHPDIHPQDNDRVLCFREGKLLLREGQLPTVGSLGRLDYRYLFSVDDAPYFLASSSALPIGCTLQDVRQLRREQSLPKHEIFAILTGKHLADWYRDSAFCGRCGTRTNHSPTERAMVCPHCKNTVYPKICPAVIVAVHDGDRLLLTRYRGRPFKKYALIAGFNEIGESIEDTVHREVMEEAGLRVKNLRFYKSQPWVFTDTLLMGFVCELDGSDRITVQESELAEASWHLRSELPEDHSHISLTGEMIEQFRLGRL